MNNFIYLDYAASTPLDLQVVEKMSACLSSPTLFANAASRSHKLGQQAAQAIEQAREAIAATINAQTSDSLVFTSGATEANNLAIKGIADFHQRRGKHIITWATEHHAILDPCEYLSRRGYDITYLNPLPNGLFDLAALKAAIRDDTILISCVYVNSETGITQDVKKIVEIAHARGVYCHVDAAQAVGKIAVDVQSLEVDLLSLSAHKVYGPKGIGALYIKPQPRVRLTPQMQGGGHEHGLRSGTLATHQIVGMGAAFKLVTEKLANDQAHAKILNHTLLEGLSAIKAIKLNSDPAHAVPNIVNVSFLGLDTNILLPHLSNLALSTGSACNSGSLEPSYVLTAMGLAREVAASAVRFSFGRFTTIDEINTAIKEITDYVSCNS